MSEERKFETEKLAQFTLSRKAGAKENSPFIVALKNANLPEHADSEAYLSIFVNEGDRNGKEYSFLSGIISAGTGDEREEFARFTLSRKAGAAEGAPYQAPISALKVVRAGEGNEDAWLKIWRKTGQKGDKDFDFLSATVEVNRPKAEAEPEASKPRV